MNTFSKIIALCALLVCGASHAAEVYTDAAITPANFQKVTARMSASTRSMSPAQLQSCKPLGLFIWPQKGAKFGINQTQLNQWVELLNAGMDHAAVRETWGNAYTVMGYRCAS
ncbi:MAG: hypothetical protein ACRD33_00170 [Candidatus Acidiferrales bacterium]